MGRAKWAYPRDLDDRMMRYLLEIRNLPKDHAAHQREEN